MLNEEQFRGLATKLREPDGGYTVNARTGAHSTSGYAVSEPGHEETAAAAMATGANVRAYAERHAPALADPRAHLGGWHNPEDNMAYHDVSYVHPTFQQGYGAMLRNKQLAMADLGQISKGNYDTAEFDPHTGVATKVGGFINNPIGKTQRWIGGQREAWRRQYRGV